MIKKVNLFGFFIAGAMLFGASAIRAQSAQFVDCSKGGGQCDSLYASDELFLAPDCVDCFSGDIQVEPAVTKTSYQPLAYSMPANNHVEVLPNGAVRSTMTQVSGVRNGMTDVQTTRKVERVEDRSLSGKWVTRDTNEKVAFGEEVHDWDAARGETLKSLLTQWSEVSGWTLVWKMDRDYNLEAGVVFRGTFSEVAGAIIRTFARAKPAPIGTFYRGNRVLVVSIQEDENAH